MIDIHPQIKTGRQIQRNWKALLWFLGACVIAAALVWAGVKIL